MKRLFSRASLIWLVLVMMLGFVVTQGFYVWTDYAHIQLGIVKRYTWIASVERSSLLTMKGDPGKYLRFLNLYIPPDAPVVLSPAIEAGTLFRQQLLSSQSIMQFYLFPRPILLCDQDYNAECIRSLTNPDAFVLAIGNFPPPEYMEGKVFIPFPEPVENIKGVYAPAQLAQRLPVPDAEAYGHWAAVPISAPFIDVGILLALFVLGFVFVTMLIPHPTWLDILSLSFPLAIGVLSWSIFITSFSGVPITLPTITLWYGILLLAGILIHRLHWKSWPALPETNPIKPIRQAWKNGRVALLLGLAVFVWFGLGGLIALGRGYSTFDDIVNWCLKGYAVAFQHSIWAGNHWGGHVLAYPLNLQLTISIFRLADGDLLPGSKALFPILSLSLLLECYRFWRQQEVNMKFALAGLLLIFTIPAFFWYSTVGFANAPFTAYLVLATLWSFEGLHNRKTGPTLVGGFLFAFAGWTRPEGIGYSLVMLVVIYITAVIVMRNKATIRQMAASLLPTIVFPITWLVLVGAKSMRQDQIGGALKTFLPEVLHGRFHLEALRAIALFARDYYMGWRIAGYVVPISLAILFLLLPLSGWFKDRSRFRLHLSMLLITSAAALVPAIMFYVDSFSEGNFAVFLEVSFDRACFPAVVLLVVNAVLILSAALEPNRAASFEAM